VIFPPHPAISFLATADERKVDQEFLPVHRTYETIAAPEAHRETVGPPLEFLAAVWVGQDLLDRLESSFADFYRKAQKVFIERAGAATSPAHAAAS
jgi:hypothetical protein